MITRLVSLQPEAPRLTNAKAEYQLLRRTTNGDHRSVARVEYYFMCNLILFRLSNDI
jgi:hypothetical protein